MASEQRPSSNAAISGLARTAATLLYFFGSTAVFLSGVMFLSVGTGWVSAPIAGVAVRLIERGAWFTFGLGGLLFSLGLMIDALADVRDRALGGPL